MPSRTSAASALTALSQAKASLPPQHTSYPSLAHFPKRRRYKMLRHLSSYHTMCIIARLRLPHLKSCARRLSKPLPPTIQQSPAFASLTPHPHLRIPNLLHHFYIVRVHLARPSPILSLNLRCTIYFSTSTRPTSSKIVRFTSYNVSDFLFSKKEGYCGVMQ